MEYENLGFVYSPVSMDNSPPTIGELEELLTPNLVRLYDASVPYPPSPGSPFAPNISLPSPTGTLSRLFSPSMVLSSPLTNFSGLSLEEGELFSPADLQGLRLSPAIIPLSPVSAAANNVNDNDDEDFSEYLAHPWIRQAQATNPPPPV